MLMMSAAVIDLYNCFRLTDWAKLISDLEVKRLKLLQEAFICQQLAFNEKKNLLKKPIDYPVIKVYGNPKIYLKHSTMIHELCTSLWTFYDCKHADCKRFVNLEDMEAHGSI